MVLNLKYLIKFSVSIGKMLPAVGKEMKKLMRC